MTAHPLLPIVLINAAIVLALAIHGWRLMIHARVLRRLADFGDRGAGIDSGIDWGRERDLERDASDWGAL